MAFKKYLFIGIGATGAMFTLRETYEHVKYLDGRRIVEIRDYHHKNLGQTPAAAMGKALEASNKLGLPLQTTEDSLAKDLREIKRASKEEIGHRIIMNRKENAIRTLEYAAHNDVKVMDRLVAKEGVFNFGFGKYLGQSMYEVIKFDFDYVSYLLENDFCDDLTKAQLETIIENQSIEKHESAYVGTEGERQKFSAHVKRNIPFETIYGMSAVITLADDVGNELVLFSTASFPGIGVPITFNAKVKEHKEYNGTKQTVLQRPTKIEEMNHE